MIIRPHAGSTEYAVGLIRSAQARMKVSSTRMLTGDGGDPEVQRELRLAQAEQRLAMRMLKTEAGTSGSLLDIVA